VNARSGDDGRQAGRRVLRERLLEDAADPILVHGDMPYLGRRHERVVEGCGTRLGGGHIPVEDVEEAEPGRPALVILSMSSDAVCMSVPGDTRVDVGYS